MVIKLPISFSLFLDRDKLGVAAINEEQQHAPETVLQRPDGPLRNDTLEAQPVSSFETLQTTTSRPLNITVSHI